MKNIFKSLFIAGYPLLSLVVFVLSVFNVFLNANSLQDIGNIISSATVIVFFVGLFLISQARTSKNLNIYSIFLFVGLGISFIPLGDFNSFVWTKAIFTISIALGWLAYVHWYSVFEKRDNSSLHVGNLFPELELETIGAEKIKTSQFLGNPTIYLFYRGNWCPLCMAQINEIAQQYKELEDRNVNMVFVSPQPHSHTISLTKKHNLGFHFLQDTNNAMAKKLGILAENGLPAGFQALGYASDTVMPTVIITDKNGEIAFADLTDNYRVRPEPTTFLRVIDAMK